MITPTRTRRMFTVKVLLLALSLQELHASVSVINAANKYCEMQRVVCRGLNIVSERIPESALVSREATIEFCTALCDNTEDCRVILMSDPPSRYPYCHMRKYCVDKTTGDGFASLARKGSGFCPGDPKPEGYCKMEGQNCVSLEQNILSQMIPEILSSGARAGYCHELCDQNPECKVVMMTGGYPYCVLRKDCFVTQDVTGADSYAKRGSGMCPGDPSYGDWQTRVEWRRSRDQRYCVWRGKTCTNTTEDINGYYTWPNSPITLMKVTDMCERGCDFKRGCTAFTVLDRPGRMECRFKTGCSGITSQTDYTTYVKKGSHTACPKSSNAEHQIVD